MADNCFRVGVSMMGIEIDNALVEKISETTFAHTVQLTTDKIAP